MGQKYPHYCPPEIGRRHNLVAIGESRRAGVALALLIGLSICAFLMVSCGPAAKPALPRQLGAWLVYWAAESGLAELKAHGALFHQVSLFAYELDEAGNPRPGPGVVEITPRFLKLAGDKGYEPWVTIVNDVQYSERKVLKDRQFLEHLLEDQTTRSAHVRSLVAMVKNNGFTGLTLDYEGFDSRQEGAYVKFITELSLKLAKDNLGLNVPRVIHINHSF